jgi:regulatory protein
MWRRKISNEEIQRKVGDPELSQKRTMARAVRLLAAKPRSIAELRERLLEKSWTDHNIVDAVILKLREYKYLDDDQYARDLALSKLRQKPQGRRRLVHRLSQKKLERSTLDTAITAAYEALPEAELIDDAIEKRLRVKGMPRSHADRKKLTEHLLRQGFDYGLIRQKLQDRLDEASKKSPLL